MKRPVRAVALLMAVSVLAALVAISVPFLLSMILHGRAARVDLNAAQAQAGADGASARGLAHLYRHLLKAPGYDPSPDLDTPEELLVPMALPNLDVMNPYGELWSCRIEDEQGKVNLNSAPPNLIGNLMASTTLAESVQKGSAVLLVNDSNAFPIDDDPATVDGFVRVDGDIVPYCHVSGGQVILKPEGDYCLARNHRKGALVYDGRAAWIANYKFAPGSSVFRPFRSVYEIKVAGGGHPLLAIRADEFAQIEPFITAHSGRDGPMWGKAEICTGTIQETRQAFTFTDNRGFGPGTILRIAQYGSALTHARVEWVFIRGNRTTIVLEQQVGISAVGSGVNNEIFLEPEMRHPININTAPREVIAACIIGVGLSRSTETVTREQADMVADLLKRGTYRVVEDLRTALNEIEKRGILTNQLADAIFINATEPNSPKIRGNTVPFCFRSYGSFSIEGSAVVNADNGVPLARSTLRQIVTLPTPPPGQFELKSQEDFELLVDKGLTQKVVTWPIPLNQARTIRGSARDDRTPDPDRGGVRLTTGQVGSHGNYALDEFISHCDDFRDPRFFQDGYDLTEREIGWQLRAPATRNGFMPATGVEMWVNPKGGGGMTFFDSGETEERNRAVFKYDPAEGGLVIQIFDANLRGYSVRYIWPYQVVNGDWQHIAGSWRTSLPGGQEIRVDAQLHPEDRPFFDPSATLGQDLKIEDVGDTAMLGFDKFWDSEGVGFVDEGGAVRIGDEIIEYDEFTGRGLKGLRRGARMSAAAPHAYGETIVPYGYACAMAGPLAIGGATLKEEMELDPKNCRVVAPEPKFPKEGVPYNVTDKLPVNSTDGFPTSGFILVSGELIYYGKTSAMAFEKLVRGLDYTPASGNRRTAKARDLRHNSRVTLCSIWVTNHKDYEPDGVVQIDREGAQDPDKNPEVEWIKYGCKTSMDGKSFLLSHISVHNNDVTITQLGTKLTNENSLGRDEFRASLGTPQYKHDAGAKVIPVVRMSGPQCGDQYMKCRKGVSDVDILLRGHPKEDGDTDRWIKRAFVEQWAHWHYNAATNTHTWDDWHFHYWVGLDDFVSRRYPAGTGHLVKFPTGELPDVVRPRFAAQGMHGGGVPQGDVDEVKVVSLPSRGAKIAWDESKGLNYGLAAGDTTLLIELPHAWPKPDGAGNAFAHNTGAKEWPPSGLIRIDNGDECEFIFYRQVSTANLTYHADVLPPYDPLKEYGPPFPSGNLNGKTNHEVKHPDTGEWVEKPNNNDEKRTVVRLSGLQRGLLNTVASDYPPGTGVMLYDAAPITILNGGLPNRGGSLSLLEQRGFPQEEGYAWINEEVVGWYKKGFELGEFRGRFGTPVQTHAANDLVRCLPSRYWDRDAADYLGDGLAFMQAGHYAADAVWQYLEVKYDSGAFGRQPMPHKSRPRILVRFDGQPRWDERPTNRQGGLYQFYGGGRFPFRGPGPGGGAIASQIEIRIYWHYDGGAFVPQHDWKRSFGIVNLKASYFSPLVTQRVDEIERR